MFDLGEIIKGLLSKDSVLAEIFKGKEKKLQEFQIDLIKALNEQNAKQIEVNKIEAQSNNKFASSWRPMVGYICAFALAYNFILQPFLIVGFQILKISLVPPVLEISQLVSILFAMLGMGGIRTYEKIKLNK